MSNSNKPQQNFICFEDFEEYAKKTMKFQDYTYYRSGSNSEITLQNNKNGFEKIMLNPRVCVDVSKVDISTTVLGQKIEFPVCVAPTALHKLGHPDGEINTARAAAEFGIIYTLSNLASQNFDVVAQANKNGIRWFQLYMTKERKFVESMVRIAEKNGYTAIVLTVDTPILGRRLGDERNKFSLPPNIKLEVLESQSSLMKLVGDTGSGLFKLFQDQIDPSLNWNDVKWLKSFTKLPIVLKGIQSYEDAKKSAEIGCHVWVSNHGGRQLDSVRGSIDMLPECVAGVKSAGNPDIEVYFDGGIRRGTDIIKAIALGAKCCFVGRAIVFGNAYNGYEGTCKMLELLKQEIIMGLKLLGVSKLSELNSDCLVKASIPKPNL